MTQIELLENLKGPTLLKKTPIMDARGNLLRLYCKNILHKKYIKENLNQINLINTKKKGTIRGLHYQIGKFAEIKIIQCIQGQIFDVIIDVRKKSKNYLKKFYFILSEKNHNILIVPKGYAHGFQSMTNNTSMIYMHTSEYNVNFERGLNPLDPYLKIEWPIKSKIISTKDENYPLLKV